MKLAYSFTPAPDTTRGKPTCYSCTGSGKSDAGKTCPRCGGTGQEP